MLWTVLAGLGIWYLASVAFIVLWNIGRAFFWLSSRK